MVYAESRSGFSFDQLLRLTPCTWGLKNGHFAIGGPKIKFIKKRIFLKKYLSKFTLRKGPQSAAHFDERLQSDGQKTVILPQKGIFRAKWQFFGHHFVTAHRNELPIAAPFSG